MSTSAVSSLSLHQKLDAYFGLRHRDLRQLGQALQSGDLAGAQQEYSAIQNLGQRGPFSKGQPFLNSDREQAFEAIGSALQSGDLAAARQAFQQLRSDLGASSHQPSPAVPALPAENPAADVSSGTSLSVKA